jgi:hypothetical protein
MKGGSKEILKLIEWKSPMRQKRKNYRLFGLIEKQCQKLPSDTINKNMKIKV